MNIKEEINVLSTEILNTAKLVDKELKTLAAGRLSIEMQHGRLCLVKQTYENGKRKRKNLDPGSTELVQLVRRQVLEAQLDSLRHDYHILQNAVKEIQDFNFTAKAYEIKEKIKMLNDEVITNALRPESDNSWASEPYEKLVYPTDAGKTNWHITSFGLKVRSKSELLIAELLHKYNIEFRYEQMIHIGNTTLAPDFTIRRRDGKIFYWEHEGLTNSQEYINRQLKKHQMYAGIGIVPWDNLIITYDNKDGIIDLRIVESEIKNKLLV